ncbi:ribonuclease H-like domain-containing protein [Tanacetum coccineum]|uniref:Ribonuclease H-like domain-containing protein n=1 Tax=Tanacetum coccineum TaxID=301880 RepID=A0ABQ5BNZ7_9ASTR
MYNDTILTHPDLKDDKSLQELRLSDNNMSTLSTELLVFAGLLEPSLQVFQLDGNPLRRCSYALTKLALFKEKAHESPSGAHVSPFGVELPFHDVISKPDSIEFGLINPYSSSANPDYNPSSPQYRFKISQLYMGDNETIGAQTSDVQDNPSTVTDAMNVGWFSNVYVQGVADEIPPPPPPPPPSSSQTPTQQTPHTVSTIKLPILKKGEYDIWAMKMEHYLAHTDYPIWEVIQNGNGPVSITTDTQGQIKVLPPRTTEEILAREREREARTTFLMALPEDHLAKFH